MTDPSTQSSATVASNAAICAHFGECGGCESQDVPYDEQVERKARDLEALFAAHWDAPIPVTPSPVVWNYRNKVDFNFAPRHYPEPPPKDFVRETVVGFTRKGKWFWPIDVGDCRIGPEGTDKLLESVRAWYKDEGVRAYDSRTKQGVLRVLLVREGTRTGQKMVVVFTSPGDFDNQAFVDAVLAAYPANCIYRGIYEGVARGAFADETELLHGEPAIEEELIIPDDETPRALRFRISPLSFFQTNTLATERLYGHIRAWVKKVSPSILYDLYGGAGGIAFSCSDLVDAVRSVESEAQATADGEHNAKLNTVDNVYFTTEKMRHYLRYVSESGGMEANSAAVLDPPRGGLTPKPLKRLIECAPNDILYVSCKPSVLNEELNEFLKTYDLVGLSAVDLFPHTPHVEVLASLKRR